MGLIHHRVSLSFFSNCYSEELGDEESRVYRAAFQWMFPRSFAIAQDDKCGSTVFAYENVFPVIVDVGTLRATLG